MSWIGPPPQTVITPVSEFRRTVILKTNQTTITQSMKDPDSNSDDTALKRKILKPEKLKAR